MRKLLLKLLNGKVQPCTILGHDWDSFRIVTDDLLEDLEPEEGQAYRYCKRDTCQASR